MKIFTAILFLLSLPSLWMTEIAAEKYKTELKKARKESLVAFAFDKHSDPLLADIRKDIHNYKELSFMQRLALFPIMGIDVIVVTKDLMPDMYCYVEALCADHGVAMPTIFITRGKNFFNALAVKLLMSVGGITIGQELINECSDEEIEAIIAHEIGHIKYEHANKKLFISVLSTCISYWIAYKITPCREWSTKRLAHFIFIDDLIHALLIGKRFEREADLFATRNAGKAAGIVSFFQKIQQKEKKTDKDRAMIYALLAASHNDIDFVDYYSLWRDYYLTAGIHHLQKAYKWMYHNTFFGAHPSPTERIAAAQRQLPDPSDL